MSEPTYKITYLTGEMKFVPPTYILTELPNGEGLLESEFMTMTGDYETLRINARLAGIKVEFK